MEEKLWAMQLVTNSVMPDRWYVSSLVLPIQCMETDHKTSLRSHKNRLTRIQTQSSSSRNHTDLGTFGRDHTRNPPDKAEMASTTILKVKIVNGSGKIRTGGPGDEKKDTEKEDLLERVWTGVVPMWEIIGDPISRGHGRVKDVPAHVRAFRDDTNKINEKYAKTAAEAET